MKPFKVKYVVVVGAIVALVAAGVAYAEVGDQDDAQTDVVVRHSPTPIREVTMAPTFIPGTPVEATCPEDPALPCEIEGFPYTPPIPTNTFPPSPTPTRCAAVVLQRAGEPYEVYGPGSQVRTVSDWYDTLQDTCTGEVYARDPVTGEESRFPTVGDGSDALVTPEAASTAEPVSTPTAATAPDGVTTATGETRCDLGSSRC